MNFKRIFSSVLVCTLIASAISVNAYGVNNDDVKGIIDTGDVDLGDIKFPDPAEKCEFALKPDGTYEITGHEGITGSFSSYMIILPSSYNGKPVTSIGRYAFARDSSGKFDNIKQIIIPDSITSIGSCAFAGCLKLSDITIPSSVKHFGTEVFDSTPWLEAKRAADPLIIINNILIDGQTAKGDINIPNGVTSINDYSFEGNENITSVNMPDSIKTIGDGAFLHCYDLTRVKLSSNVTSIGECAFQHCNITELTLPKGLKTIEHMSFWGNEFTELNIPNGVETISEDAFAFCTKLKSVNIPNSVKNIGEGAFRECRSLKSITIPESVVLLDQYAFLYSALNTIIIKNPECVIGDNKSTIPSTVTIHGYSGSTAEDYAKKYSNKFVSLNNVIGDVNGDGKTNIRDAAYIAIMLSKGMGSQLPACADYNKDGKCNIRDAAAIAIDLAKKAIK